ncbi:putative plastidic glucose transporter 2 isoform X2 [Carex littledalei]|uniref:Putative plastidic glucose transporter 2 isoform X2 n=1 Tax=Carex littledalei TaxID=544730 RepID=A0A833VJU4_9POAL|nr:putative plastidic glucose transporter 2 isoform X2 [Carex littledalei]
MADSSGGGGASKLKQSRSFDGNDAYIRADKIDLTTLDIQLEKHYTKGWTKDKAASGGGAPQGPREDWEIDPLKLEIRYVIAHGTYGTVYRGTYDGRDVAVKSALLQENGNPPWKLSLPHICVATLVSFLFGYHVSVVNEPLESISLDLGFAGNTLAEGLVVSTCLGGAFVGCLFSGSIADGIGRRRSFQLSALPMIIGAALSASSNRLEGMLLGRFLVGTGMGLGPPIASLYVTEISPSYVRGTYGSFIQIATCLGIIAALFIGIPVKDVTGWYRAFLMISSVGIILIVMLLLRCGWFCGWF